MSENELNKHLISLHRILLGMNAYGTLDLTDLSIIEQYISSSFGIDLQNTD